MIVKLERYVDNREDTALRTQIVAQLGGSRRV
jgi:hypothetical protein